MIIFMIFFVLVGYILSKFLGYGLSFVGIFLVFSGLATFSSYFFSDKLVIASSGAKLADKKTYRQLYTTVENLSIAAGIPMPKVYVVDDPAPNAFATGRDPKHAAVVATTGLLEVMKNAELEGVISHELSHVRGYDTRLMGVVAILVGSLVILSDFVTRSMFFGGFSRDNDRETRNGIFVLIALLVAILAPIAAMLIQLAISRRREYQADASGVLLTRYPEGLASALEKIAANPRVLKHASNATAHLYIENPYKADTKKHTSWLINLFSTHPPAEERIKILRSM